MIFDSGYIEFHMFFNINIFLDTLETSTSTISKFSKLLYLLDNVLPS
jgi:hypothetical protein